MENSYTTISHELESKYPEFEGRFGETITQAELSSVLEKHGDLHIQGESSVLRKDEPETDDTKEVAPKAPRASKSKKAKTSK